MRLLDRYVLRELLVPLGYCLSGFMLFWIAFSLISELHRYQEASLTLFDVVELYGVKIPGDLALILPVALLLAALYALTNHARHNEITAIRAAGVGLLRICLPYLAVGLALSALLFGINEFWMPDSSMRQDEIMNRRGTNRPGVSSRDIILKSGFINARDVRSWKFESYNLETSEMVRPILIRLVNGTNLWLDADHARRLNGVWTFFGSSTFSTNNIANLGMLAARLKHPAASDGVARHLKSQLHSNTLNLLLTYDEQEGAANEVLKQALVTDFNRSITSGPFYDASRFEDIKLSPEALQVLRQDPQGTTLTWLNRTLLLGAFPVELKQGGLSVREFGYPASAGVKGEWISLTDTNMLAMPELSETPAQIKREMQFNRHFGSKVDFAKPTEIPVFEILDYLDLHPTGLTERQLSKLHTELHGRLAAPWTCFVVVLIAIPFGAASGRRNLFVGVAASIGIFFTYFVLLKLGLALGSGGYLPAWLAAWLPNLTFGIASVWMMLRVR